jgi:histone acetyltransferase (RNA polymerase elongator complex component)
LIVPIFIPNQGCPHRCIFCEQEKISSQKKTSITAAHVRRIIDQAISSKKFDCHQTSEIAFFGGTFTSLPLQKIKELLSAALPYIKDGPFHSIRISTRPDAIEQDRLNLMKDFEVQTVELGAQSMNDRVLTLSNRGHSARDTEKAFTALRTAGFRLGLQLMPGLPGDTDEIFRETIRRVIALRPDFVRLYPALVISGTGLADLYESGKYFPLSLEKAVELSKNACINLEAEGIPVIRIGLMSSPTLLEPGMIIAGPWHPAFGHLVRSAIYQKGIEQELMSSKKACTITLHAREKDISLLRGYKNSGLEQIRAVTGAERIKISADNSIPPGKIRIETA